MLNFLVSTSQIKEGDVVYYIPGHIRSSKDVFKEPDTERGIVTKIQDDKNCLVKYDGDLISKRTTISDLIKG